ncbi:MAG: hypothetical protein LBI10_07100 [Deltaproteobacteria bacterium]|jgi:hypothetical protein|nr:hypothetical protein [Deltaproteobacteria bacterium]
MPRFVLRLFISNLIIFTGLSLVITPLINADQSYSTLKQNNVANIAFSYTTLFEHRAELAEQAWLKSGNKILAEKSLESQRGDIFGQVDFRALPDVSRFYYSNSVVNACSIARVSHLSQQKAYLYLNSQFYFAKAKDKGETKAEYNWWGAYNNQKNIKLGIGNYNNNQSGEFSFSFFFEGVNGEEFDGTAAVNDDQKTAEYMDLVFTISDDSQNIVVTQPNPAADGSERQIFLGAYTRSED